MPAVLFGQNTPPAKKIVVLLLGAPGSGKTTQAKNLSRKYKIPSYSMATILKKEAGWVKTKFKKNMSVLTATGDFLNDELANQLVEKYIITKKARNGFIMDGYPRSLKQALYFENTLKQLGLPAPVVVHLNVPDQIARERLAKRGQKQDKPEIIDQRFADYHAEAKFLVGHYQGRIHTIDGTASIPQVWQSIEEAMARAGY